MPHKEFAKNARELLRVTPTKFEGHDLIDVRIFVPLGGRTGPTKKGVTIQVDLIPDLIDALTWALGQPCSIDGSAEEATQSPTRLSSLAEAAWQALKAHGSVVHWDSAERIVLTPALKDFSKWDLHYVLAVRKDLFERVGPGQFRALPK
jgi:hypothetical protein